MTVQSRPVKWTEPARELPVYADVDVLVAGGGSAGWHAAVAAARQGAKTLLVELHGSLGGTVTNAMVQPFMNFHDPLGRAVVGGIWSEMLDRMKYLNGTVGPLPSHEGNAPWGKRPTLTPFEPEVLRFVAQEMVLEAGAEILFHTMIVGTVMEGQALRGVIIENKSGRQVVLAKAVVDATGDADVAALAGAPFVMGRDDGLAQPMSLYIKMRNIDYDEMGRYVRANPAEFRWWSFPRVDPTLPDEFEKRPVSCSGFLSLVRTARESGELYLGRETINILPCPKRAEAVLNCTRVGRLDPTSGSDLSKAEIEARRQAMSVASWVPGHLPGFRDAELVSIAPTIGVRESRRILGEYELQVEDAVKGRRFADAIARCAYNVDIHNPHDDKSTWMQLEDAYDIPYRCLLPRRVENLLVAGRCISASHEAAGSARATPNVAATGEAAGTACALSARLGTSVRQLDVSTLQAALLRQNANLGERQAAGLQPD